MHFGQHPHDNEHDDNHGHNHGHSHGHGPALILNRGQITAFSGYMYSNFEKKAFTHLRKKFPASTKNIADDELALLIKKGISKAAHYNVVDRHDVLIFLEYIAYFGFDFDHDASLPKIIKILKIRNIKGAEKMRRIENINPLKQESK